MELTRKGEYAIRGIVFLAKQPVGKVMLISEVAMERLAAALRKRMQKKRARIATRATKSSIERRLTHKRITSHKKNLRSKPEE